MNTHYGDYYREILPSYKSVLHGRHDFSKISSRLYVQWWITIQMTFEKYYLATSLCSIEGMISQHQLATSCAMNNHHTLSRLPCDKSLLYRRHDFSKNKLATSCAMNNHHTDHFWEILPCYKSVLQGKSAQAAARYRVAKMHRMS